MSKKKPTKLNLNDFEQVTTVEELQDHVGLILTPKKLNNGTQLPNLYFRKPIKVIEIEDVDQVEWFRDIRISKEGTLDDYAHRVKWWFENALKDDKYKTILNDTFNRNGFEIAKSWALAENYLYKLTPSQRKTYIAAFVWRWLSRGMSNHLRYSKEKRSYR